MKESFYNPKIHHRRSIRLKGYDYSQAGSYFVTICCQDFKWRFGHVECGEMIYNEFGLIAYEEWAKLSERFPNFELDVFQIMPNHVHGVVVLNAGNSLTIDLTDTARETVWAPLAGAPADQPKVDQTDQPKVGDFDFAAQNFAGAPARGAPTVSRVVSHNPTLGDIIGAYKSIVATRSLEIYKSKNKTMGKFWQRNYHEHIIRNDRAYHNISKYIIENPEKWKYDRFYRKG